MNLGRDYDVMMYQPADNLAGLEHRWQLTDFSFLETPEKRPFLARIREGFRLLPQISKIHIQVTFEVREPALK